MIGVPAALPWLLPGIAVSVGLALALARPLAPFLSARPAVAGLLVLAVGTIVAATLTPIGGTFDRPTTSPASCDLRRMLPAAPSVLVRDDDAAPNVALFVPLGVAIALVPRPQRGRLLVLAVALPFAVEGLQVALPILGRGCESADVVDNLTGLAVGFGAATLVRGWRAPGFGRRRTRTGRA
jgi:hypothetical protein